MRKPLMIILILLFGVCLAFAGEKQLLIEWQQDSANLPTLKGWYLYKSEDLNAAWPWEQVGELIPYDGNPGSVYTAPFTITIPDGEETALFFKMVAEDTSGQRSGPSEMQAGAPTIIDFKPPDAPVLEASLNNYIISLTWSTADDVSRWEVYKKEGTGPFVKIADADEPAYTYDASADVGKVLTFAVVAFDQAENYSPNSNEESFDILPTPPASPFGLRVTVVEE